MNTKALPFHRHLRHPRTGKRIQALGRRGDGRFIWPIIGAEDDPNPDPPKDPDPKPDPKPDPPKDPKADPDDSWESTFKGKTPQEVKDALENSRKWETRAKGNKDKADKLDQLVDALTGGDDDKDKDPEKLAADLSSARTEARATKIENAVLRAAGRHSADGAMLVDSRSFMETVLKLDPSEDDFGSKLSEEIKKAAAENPAFTTSGGTTRPKPTRQQGNPSEGKESGVAAGRAMFESSRKRTTAAT